jgi:hypothetical protein
LIVAYLIVSAGYADYFCAEFRGRNPAEPKWATYFLFTVVFIFWPEIFLYKVGSRLADV